MTVLDAAATVERIGENVRAVVAPGSNLVSSRKSYTSRISTLKKLSAQARVGEKIHSQKKELFSERHTVIRCVCVFFFLSFCVELCANLDLGM